MNIDTGYIFGFIIEIALVKAVLSRRPSAKKSSMPWQGQEVGAVRRASVGE